VSGHHSRIQVLVASGLGQRPQTCGPSRVRQIGRLRELCVGPL
jgi:hypothetical protein